jgi:CDP-glucose 4,6-dehydratase
MIPYYSTAMTHTRELSEYLKGKKVFITGHTGFKGTWLIFLLKELGADVVGYSLPPSLGSPYEKANANDLVYKSYFEDIRDFSKLSSAIDLESPDFVIHLAAQPLVIESLEHPRETFEINTMGTVNLLDACNKSKSIRRIVLATTDKVYENEGHGEPFTESSPLRGKDPYSASKVAAESAIYAWQNSVSLSTRDKIASARAGNVIGGGDLSINRLIPDLVRAFSSKNALIIRNQDSIRPWQHVIEPLIGYLLMLTNEDSIAPALNFGPKHDGLRVKEVVQIASNEFKSELEIVYEEPKQKSLESEVLNLDSSLALTSIGWKQVWTQEEAIKRSISWWISHLEEDMSYSYLIKRDIREYFMASLTK